jgi:hypothetical protein
MNNYDVIYDHKWVRSSICLAPLSLQLFPNNTPGLTKCPVYGGWCKNILLFLLFYKVIYHGVPTKGFEKQASAGMCFSVSVQI